jgi:hypothetical protein
MNTPLMMLGPGGDYVTRFDASGPQLLSRVAQTQGHPSDADSDSASSNAGYARYRRRKPAQAADALAAGDSPVTVEHFRDADGDRFEHSLPSPAPVYTAPAKRWVKVGSLAAASAAIEAWLAQQTKALADAALILKTLRSEPDPWAQSMGDIEDAWSTRNADITHHILDDDADLDSDTDPVDGVASISASRRPFMENTYGPQTHAQAAEDPADGPRLATHTRLFPDLAGDGRRLGRQQGHRLRTRRGADQEGGLATRSEQGSLFGVGR